ncbi:MAG: DnaJ C-terminal domain-containing protein [Inhella sp.]
MEFKDYYAALGVARDAPQEAIKKAYRQLARKYHPDVSQEPDAEARMREVNEAYAVLSDPERRAAYDQLGSGAPRQGEPFRPPPGWDAGFEFGDGAGFDPGAGNYSEFFSELFGRMGRTGRTARPGTQRPQGSARGEDHHAKVLLELDDAWLGATRRITLKAPELDAQGRLHLRERTLELKIPLGVKPGQLIRLAGQGGPGLGGAPAGDLLLEVQFAPHPRFRLDGGTLVAELPLAPWEAALGAVVPVDLPAGRSVKVRVPAGAQGGQLLTVRGQGLPGSPPGDLELKLRVLLPSGLEPRARQLYEEMARVLPDFDARKQAAALAPEADA